MKTPARTLCRLIAVCENEPDFWPNSKHFLIVGEWELAFEGLYMYLLRRDDLWAKNHASIKALMKAMSGAVDFDELYFECFHGDMHYGQRPDWAEAWQASDQVVDTESVE